MAKENTCWLSGIIQGQPRIHCSRSGDYEKAAFVLKVIRRMRRGPDGLVRQERDRFDYPLIYVYDTTLIENDIASLKAGDLVDVMGVITAQTTAKNVVCGQCAQKNKLKDGVITHVTAIDLMKIGEPKDPIAALHRRHEFSNNICVIGTLCRDPKYYLMPSRTPTIQYQIAINRKFKIPDAAQEDVRSDYIWVASFGSQADEDNRRLSKGSSVYIRGGIQTREVTRKCQCGKCGAIIEFGDNVAEIVPYSVEYLHNCRFDESETEGESSEEKGSKDTDGNGENA